MYKKILVLIPVIMFGIFISTADAFHTWGGYHWARTANPFTLQLGDNVSSAWDGYLVTTASDWSTSTVLDTIVKPGKTKPRLCKPTKGRVEVCNEKYGANGWLGIAQIWVSGGTHITQGIVKMNDTYFNTPNYNTPAWKNLVMCQEVGHTLGLDHQDENFENANLDTCMDYTNNPLTNQHPNQHDFDELLTAYNHTDASTSLLALSANRFTGFSSTVPQILTKIDLSDSSAWGEIIKIDVQNHASLYKRDLGNGDAVFTHVTWAE